MGAYDNHRGISSGKTVANSNEWNTDIAHHKQQFDSLLQKLSLLKKAKENYPILKCTLHTVV